MNINDVMERLIRDKHRGDPMYFRSMADIMDDQDAALDWLISAWPHLRELVIAAEDTALIPCWVDDPNTDLATRLIDKVFAALHRPELAALKEPHGDR